MPDLSAVGEDYVTIDFTSGPNLVEYNYSISCFQQDELLPTNSCSAVASSGLEPLATVTGTLPKGYSRVVENVTVGQDNTDVDCLVTVGGGPFGKVSKCQYAGDATTDPGGIPIGYTIVVSTESSESLRVQVEEQTSRAALLDLLIPFSEATRSYVVTYKVQCLEAPAAECDVSLPTVDGDDLFTNGTVVSGLTPNTDYQCFVIASYTEDGQERYKCTSADMAAVTPTEPSPPNTVVASNPAVNSIDVSASLGPAMGNAVTVQGYAFQCLPSTETVCDPSGTWTPSSSFPSTPTTPQTVSGLLSGTTYNCFAATVAGDSAPYDFYCSTDYATASTLEASLAVVGTPGPDSFYLNAAGISDPPITGFLGWAFQCDLGTPTCSAAGTWSSTYTSAQVGDPAGVLQSGYSPNNAYTCFLGAQDASSYICPSSAAGQVAVTTSPVTTLTGTVATAGTTSIDVSNADAVDQGTADGNTYEYGAQCVVGAGGACDPLGTFSTLSATLTTPVTLTTNDDGTTAIAPNTAYTCFAAVNDGSANDCGTGTDATTSPVTTLTGTVAAQNGVNIDVSNADAVAQGTADGNTYQYAAQCVAGAGAACNAGGSWTTLANTLTSPESLSADDLGVAFAAGTYSCYVAVWNGGALANCGSGTDAVFV